MGAVTYCMTALVIKSARARVRFLLALGAEPGKLIASRNIMWRCAQHKLSFRRTNSTSLKLPREPATLLIMRQDSWTITRTMVCHQLPNVPKKMVALIRLQPTSTERSTGSSRWGTLLRNCSLHIRMALTPATRPHTRTSSISTQGRMTLANRCKQSTEPTLTRWTSSRITLRKCWRSRTCAAILHEGQQILMLMHTNKQSIHNYLPIIIFWQL